MKSTRLTLAFLATLLVVIVVLAVAIFWPFLKPLVFAGILGVGLYPLHDWIARQVRNPSAAATLSTLAVLLILVLPAGFTVATVSTEMAVAGRTLAERSRAQGGMRQFVGNLLRGPLERVARHVDLEKTGVRPWLESLPAKTSGFFVAAATFLVGGLAGFAGQTIVTFFVLFFLFRDGPVIANRIAMLMPLSPVQVERLFSSIRDTIVANLYGILAVAGAQGILTGLALEVLGMPSPLLLGVLTGFASLVPLVGTALVWVPASIYLFVTAPLWKGIALLLWGALVVSSSDNVIRPLIVKGRMQIHPLLLMFSILGGLNLFGFLGIFLGPMVLSLIVAVGDLLRDELRRQRVETVEIENA